MSNALPTDALSPEAAAPPEGDGAPAEGVTVDSGSAGQADTVPAERFNGLMAAFQKQKDEDAAKIAAYEAELASRNKQETEEPVVTDTTGVAELTAEVNRLTQLVQGLAVKDDFKAARDTVATEYPEVAPFADLVVGETPEEILDVARTIAERIRLAGDGAVPAPAADDPAPAGDPAPAAGNEPSAPVTPGAAVADGTDTLEAAKQTALESGDWFAYAKALGDQANQDATELA